MNCDDPLVTVRHVQQERWCERGAREWFKRYGMSYEDFMRNGVPASVAETKGAVGKRMAARARAEAEGTK